MENIKPLDYAPHPWYNRRMNKEIKVRMTLEWVFKKREWSSEQKHLQELELETERVLGYDTLHSLYMLNDITMPQASNIKVMNVN